MRKLTTFALFLLVLAVSPVVADDYEEEEMAEEEEELQLPVRKKRRRPSSFEDGGTSSTLNVRQRQTAADLEVRLAALAGITSLPNSSSDPGFTNAALGLNADIRVWRYIGAELDVYGDLLPARFSDGTQELSKRPYGGMLQLKGQYPFYTGSARWLPKLGGGLGASAIDFSSDDGTDLSVSTVRAVAPVFLVGVDVEVSPQIVLFADYSRSIGGVVTETRQNQETDVFEPAFDRIRLGAYYRFNENWGFGVQGLRRTLSYSGALSPFAASSGTEPTASTVTSRRLTSSGPGNEASLLQFLGMLVVEF